jgi:hypothetical protein
MNPMIAHSSAGLLKSAMLPDRVLKPPVLNVVNMWMIASNQERPQSQYTKVQTIDNPR